MKYVILRTRFFRVADKLTERREVIDQIFDCRDFADDCREDLEIFHGQGNAATVYRAEADEVREPIYEVLPIAA
ncbi:hypothetical protein G6L68_25065 [Agrobacterium fabrum]|uniref:hypothetical protein n=1 Tax=Agrobacterium fabrum TaxID=1176649 RepID=UPI000EF5A360|nr:hypothetical protein [Agrobacterium fabrum]AYM66157.1 hypothetical protein At12D13_50050 [Agrobacterium fabrum]NTE63904.1 hypothetical protein [Agrobacterium fabrum]